MKTDSLSSTPGFAFAASRTFALWTRLPSRVYRGRFLRQLCIP